MTFASFGRRLLQRVNRPRQGRALPPPPEECDFAHRRRWRLEVKVPDFVCAISSLWPFWPLTTVGGPPLPTGAIGLPLGCSPLPICRPPFGGGGYHGNGAEI